MPIDPADLAAAGPDLAHPDYDEFIDLKEIVNTLISWRREIVLMTLIVTLAAAAAVTGLRAIQTPQYAASALVAGLRVRSQVSFDNRFVTSAEQEANPAQSRSYTLAQLAASSRIADAVIAELGDALTAKERIPAEILSMIEAGPVSENTRISSDLIQITATSDSPDKSMQIANAWARHYVEEVNHLYGGAPEALRASIETELVSAQADYQKAQAALENFLKESRATSLTRQLAEKKTLIDNLERGKQAAATDLLGSYYASWETTQTLLGNAQALKRQLELGEANAVASSALAMQLLKTQAFAGLNTPQALGDQKSGQLALQVQAPDAPTLTAEQALADAAALIAALERRRSDLEGEIRSLNQQLHNGDAGQAFSDGDVSLSAEIDRLEEEVQTLKADLEADSARKEQLTLARDSAWDTFKTLKTKSTELDIVDAAVNSEVRLASPAVRPQQPVPGLSLISSILLAAVVGVMLAVAVAFLATMMDVPPFLGKNTEHSPI